MSRHESRGGSRPEDARQRRANLAGDALELIDAAVAAGLDEERAAALRKTLHRSGCTTRDIDRVGSWVRRWLDEPRGQSAPSE